MTDQQIQQILNQAADVEARFTELAPKLGADQREIEMFLSDDPEEVEAAICLIAGHVGAKLQNFDKARQTGKLLTGLHSELVAARNRAREMQDLALEAADVISHPADVMLPGFDTRQILGLDRELTDEDRQLTRDITGS